MLRGPQFDVLEGEWNSQPAKYRKVIHVVENTNTNRKYGGLRGALFLHIYHWNAWKVPRPSFAAWYVQVTAGAWVIRDAARSPWRPLSIHFPFLIFCHLSPFFTNSYFLSFFIGFCNTDHIKAKI